MRIGRIGRGSGACVRRVLARRSTRHRSDRIRKRLVFCVLLACLLLAAAAGNGQAEPVPSAGLDQALATSVIETALGVLRPRTLEPHTVQQLTVWGLNGLTAIDPDLVVDGSATARRPVRLSTPRGVLFEVMPPASDDAAGWARLAVGMAAAAWAGSPAIRGAGQQAVIQSFFDELFNHLDPYSRYVAPAPAETERTARVGGTAEAGFSVTRQGRALVVSAVNTNGPAWGAGISVGQRLLSIDGQSVRGEDPDAVATSLQGEPGSTVTLVVAAPGHPPTRVPVVRAAVPPETVFAFSNGNIVVIRVTGFSADTAQEMSQFLEQAMQHDTGGRAGTALRGLIVDLRGNRGGFLQQAVTSVALVLDHGVAVTAQGRDPQANHVWAVQGGDLTEGVPIVVLVDGRTASAAEIMAAALADHRRAVVVGSATLGKGLVQFIAQLPDGGELFVTWSRVLAPLGWPLQGLGVIPQVCTSLGQARLDQQLQDLAAGTFDERDAVAQSRAARSPLAVARILELRAACPAAIGTDADLDAARALLDTPGAYAAALVPAEPEPVP